MKDADTQIVEFPAKILARDNQLLSSGTARLYTKKCCGTFWPLAPADCRNLQGRAAILQAKDGSRYELKDFHACPLHHPAVVNHCEFDFFRLSFGIMETHRTVIGTKKLNEYIKHGWKRLHVFTKPIAWGDDDAPTDFDAAFVVVWDLPGEPVLPKKPAPPTVTES